MIIPVTCAYCKSGGTMAVQIKFVHHLKLCKSCGEIHEDAWTFNFCGPKCFQEWMPLHARPDFGFPCQDCVDPKTGVPSGWFRGFKQNGKCTTCKGKRKVEECVLVGWRKG